MATWVYTSAKRAEASSMIAAQACVARRVITASFVDSGARCLPAARVLVNRFSDVTSPRWPGRDVASCQDAIAFF